MELKEVYGKTRQKIFLTLTTIIFVFALVLIASLIYYFIFLYPENQVSRLGITNITEKANFINQYRTTSIQLISTFAQILGGIAVLIGIYFAWRRIAIAEEDLKATKEGQITERFTRAVEQLGNPAMEIRLGGIYALERIANESKKDYWPIMEILTAYVRKNSSIEDPKVNEQNKISLDIQAILTVIGRRKYSYDRGETERLDFSKTNLYGAVLTEANMEKANFGETNLQGAKIQKTDFSKANFKKANLQGTYLITSILHGANLEKANLQDAKFTMTSCRDAKFGGANLKGSSLAASMFERANFGVDEKSKLEGANLEEAYLGGANLEDTNFKGANLKGANFKAAWFERTNFEGANLEGAKDLGTFQLCQAKTLYKANLDPELEEELRAKGFGKLIDDEPKDEP